MVEWCWCRGGGGGAINKQTNWLSGDITRQVEPGGEGVGLAFPSHPVRVFSQLGPL